MIPTNEKLVAPTCSLLRQSRSHIHCIHGTWKPVLYVHCICNMSWTSWEIFQPHKIASLAKDRIRQLGNLVWTTLTTVVIVTHRVYWLLKLVIKCLHVCYTWQRGRGAHDDKRDPKLQWKLVHFLQHFLPSLNTLKTIHLSVRVIS